MKNPLELTLLEIEALMHGDADSPQWEYTRLLKYVHDRQKAMHEYVVQKQSIAVQQARAVAVPKKASSSRDLDAELLDEAEIVIL